MYDHILIATDGSEDATAGADHAIELARKFDATLHILFVIETRTAYDNAIVDPKKVLENLRSDGEDSITTIEKRTEHTLATVSSIVEGIPHEEILTYITDHDIDMVVMGTKGRSAFKAVLFGSATEAVLRSTHIPVLVVGAERS